MPTKKIDTTAVETAEVMQPEELSVPQTDFETPEGGGSLPESTLLPQTDSQNENFAENLSEDDVEERNNTSSPQTEMESEEKQPEEARPARRTRKPRAKSSEPDAESNPDQENASSDAKPRRRRSSVRPSSVISIDEQLGVETEADKARDALLDLVESMKTKRILTGTIQGVERPPDNPSVLWQSFIMVISRL